MSRSPGLRGIVGCTTRHPSEWFSAVVAATRPECAPFPAIEERELRAQLRCHSSDRRRALLAPRQYAPPGHAMSSLFRVSASCPRWIISRVITRYAYAPLSAAVAANASCPSAHPSTFSYGGFHRTKNLGHRATLRPASAPRSSRRIATTPGSYLNSSDPFFCSAHIPSQRKRRPHWPHVINRPRATDWALHPPFFGPASGFPLCGQFLRRG